MGADPVGTRPPPNDRRLACGGRSFERAWGRSREPIARSEVHVGLLRRQAHLAGPRRRLVAVEAQQHVHLAVQRRGARGEEAAVGRRQGRRRGYIVGLVGASLVADARLDRWHGQGVLVIAPDVEVLGLLIVVQVFSLRLDLQLQVLGLRLGLAPPRRRRWRSLQEESPDRLRALLAFVIAPAAVRNRAAHVACRSGGPALSETERSAS
mmetsp:Transcript_13146/g.37821  ORF Transcript_13146/g.37821 Transcript_13146/m.37821 type:complete len:209 (+) Transcript_13146:133-759(+)